MLESLVASLLNRFLVKNFDPKQLNIGIWSGDVKLRNLELKREALDKFRLPIDVVEGHLGELTLQIPWSNLKNKPVKVFIENVYVLAIPKANQEYDEVEEERRKQLLKMERLEDVELLLQAQPESISTEEQKKNQSFTESLVTKIIDNLQITVKKIHIRYEDTISAPGHPFSLGITLGEFSAVSADEDWNPIFIQDNVLTTHKLTKLENLAVYWNTDSELLSANHDLNGVLQEFGALIPVAKKSQSQGQQPAISIHQFVLKPVSGEGRITIHKGSPSSIPNSKAELFFDEIGFMLDEDQYRDALMLIDLFHFYVRTEQFKNLRPKLPLQKDPNQWFKYAGNVVLREIHEKRRQWSWEFFKERMQDRKQYISLYKAKITTDNSRPLLTSDSDKLKALEWKLSFEDLRFYRSLAQSQLRKERKKLKQLADGNGKQVSVQDKPAQSQGWWGWAWGSSSSSQQSSSSTDASGASPSNESSADDAVMTDQQRKELYDAIEWNEDQKPIPDVLDLPRDAVKMQLKVSLAMGSFTLRRDPHGAQSEILKLLFDTFSMSFLQRPDSFLVDLTLQELKVHDGTTPGSLFPDIVRVKKPRPVNDPTVFEIDTVDDVIERPPAEPVFKLTFEKNPLDESADSVLIMKLASMEIYYNKQFIEEIAKFFRPPKTHLESFGALMYAAGATVEGITNQTRAGLEYALQEHKTLNAKLDVQAPLIIVPSSLTDRRSPCLVVDAGHISLVSNLVDKSTIREIQGKQSSQYQDEDYEKLKSLMYDKFELNLQATQVLVGPSIPETIEQLYVPDDDDKPKHFHVVDKINMKLLVEISILAKASNLTKFRVSGHLPVLHVSISDVKYKILMHLINNSMPNLSYLDRDNVQIEELEMGFEDSHDDRIARSSARPAPFTFSSQAEIDQTGYVDYLNARGDDDEDEDNDDAQTIVGSEQSADSSRSLTKNDRKNTNSNNGNTNSNADLAYQQRTFEFNFTVDQVRGSLYRGGPITGLYGRDANSQFTKSRLLVDVVLEHFELIFFNRMYDMQAAVILSKLSVEDRIDDNPKPEFSRLISSDSYYDHPDEHSKDLTEPKEGDENLFHIKYSKVSKESPEYLAVFDGIDQNVEISISTLNFVITRKSILTLLDFLAVMFSADNNTAAARGDDNQIIELDESDSETEVASVQTNSNEPEKTKLKLNLYSIVLILNDDGIRLATLRLDQADVGIFTMAKTMRVAARLGNFSLQDHLNDQVPEHLDMHELVSIQGDELADFRYETYDPYAVSPSYPGYNSSVYFRAGSIKVNFIEQSFRRIFQFLAKFAEMKTLYDSARQAAVNQASQMKDPDKIHLDVIVRTPILVFSRDCPFDNPEGEIIRADVITAHLGEMYVHNTFSTIDTSLGRQATVNKINAGIRQTRITSKFHFPNDVSQESQMIENLDISFKMVYVEHTPGLDRPQLEIVGSMSDVNLKMTESQYIFIIGLLKSLSATFETPPPQNDEAAVSLRRQASSSGRETPVRSSKRVRSRSAASFKDHNNHKTGKDDVARRESSSRKEEEKKNERNFTKLDFVFRLQTLALELFNDTDSDTVTALPASLSKFSLNGTDIKMRMESDDSIESEFHIKSFTILDSRQKQKNKFREIVPSIKHDGYQFMASISKSVDESGFQNITAILSIDSPQFIFAIDYIFSLKTYFVDSLQVEDEDLNDNDDNNNNGNAGVASDSESTVVELASTVPVANFVDDNDRDCEDGDLNSQAGIVNLDNIQEPTMNVAFRVNIVDASVILIANPLVSNSEAIVLGIKDIIISKQNVFTLATRKVGMFLCRMDHFEDNRLRVLDDFNFIFSADDNASGLYRKTSISMSVDPLVLRLSLRDILLALSIVNKAAELSPEHVKPVQKRPYSRFSANKRLKQQARRQKSVSHASRPESLSSSVSPSNQQVVQKQAQSALLRREDFTADFDGLRLVLIGGIHELPLLDLCIKQFPVHLHNWSTDMDADASLEMFVNVYNYSKSAWEPLIEPWHLGFHMTRTIDPPNISINFNSRKSLEVTVTSQTIAILSTAVEIMSGDDLLTRPPGTNAPYRIMNQTGYDIQVWVDNNNNNNNGSENNEFSMAKEIKDGEEVPWRFDDWRKLRENLSEESQHGAIGVRLKDTNFDAVTKIQASKEGETLYVLQPRTMKVAHRLVCEVKLRPDKVKQITLRSALLIENNTHIPIEVMTGNPEVSEPRIITIVPNESHAVPIDRLYDQSLKIKPGANLGFKWCEETLFWRNLLGKYAPYVTCKSENSDDDDGEPASFFFQICSIFDKSAPLSRLYPRMRIRVTAPIEVENLLPYDFNYMIYDKHTKKEWSNFLRKGLCSPIHVVKLSHLLLMSVHMRDSGFERTDFAIINSNIQDEFQRENKVATRNRDGQKLNLSLHYYTIPDSGGAFRISVYSPYIILNKTGMDLQVKAKSILASSHSTSEENDQDPTKRKAVPKMFSYQTDERSNRALIKVEGSLWSSPQSFEAVGGNTDAVITSENRQSEIHIGINVSEGQGKYKMSKIVSISPRFILKNKLGEELNIREPGSSTVMKIKAGQVYPLHFLRQVDEKQLSLSFPAEGAPWSAPFNISDLGRTHVKVVKPGQGHKLLKIEVLIEQATIFLHIDYEKSNWPFSIRNFSNTEFTFYQANPYITYDDDDGMAYVNNNKRFRPIVYRVPRKSVMPYSWDYPAARTKELVVCARDTERHVPLAEIGNLVPLKLPPGNDGHPVTIDINVVADGPIQTLVLSDYDQSRSLYKPKFNSSQASLRSGFLSSNSSTAGFEIVEDEGDISFRAVVNFEGLGISLINARLQELCYITFRGIEFKYTESALYQTVSMKMKWIQIDNQLFGGIYPIILYPSVLPQTAKEMENHPTLSASVSRVKDDSHGVFYVKYATILLQQITVEMDEDFLFALLDFSKVPGASWTNLEEDKLCDETLEIPEPVRATAGRDVYFEVLHIQPAQMDLSFVRTERVNVEDKTSSQNAIMFFLNVLTMAIGNINDAPVQLNALLLENARVSLPMLAQLMATHYGQQFLFQVHKILGSADFLGNPVGLFNNLSSGVMDMFYEPYQGFIMNETPQELGIGIAKGGMSFLRKSVFGVSDSIAKVTGSISKGLAVATLDKQFQDRRRISRIRNRPRHALFGVTAGANSFVEGLASGISGMALAPMKGASEEGAAGFFKGLGKGLVGLPTKTAIGIFDLASNVSEGIRNTTTVFDNDGIDRVRLPRFIGREMIVKPYSQREAIGQVWLKQVNEGDYFNEEYVAHMALPGEELVVIVTYTRILLMHTRRMQTQWDVRFDQLQTVSLEKGGIAMTLWGGVQGPFIPIADESSRQFLYNRIGNAVEEYNQYRQALV
ncbi:hypothetical protein V1514DRAFT_282762 [Lipomyces japonicus]|uniref:uncharacterized protein n=1 Tax=Lipomyces japonicus TaxID=56871 RepID=UPI0034CF4751